MSLYALHALRSTLIVDSRRLRIISFSLSLISNLDNYYSRIPTDPMDHLIPPTPPHFPPPPPPPASKLPSTAHPAPLPYSYLSGGGVTP
ncbi:unnamed protein product [Cutaneotrichosporon oleaginosum]